MALQGGLAPAPTTIDGRAVDGRAASKRALSIHALAARALCVTVLLTFGASAETARVPHPEPRVIVTVTSIRGGHDRLAVQRAARETWGRIVKCYKEDGSRERGKVVLRLEVSAAGQVVGARRLESSFSGELTDCLRDGLRRKTMPKARSGSSATVEIQLAPGDE